MGIVHISIDIKVLKTIRSLLMSYILDNPEDKNEEAAEIINKIDYIIDVEEANDMLNKLLEEVNKAKYNAQLN